MYASHRKTTARKKQATGSVAGRKTVASFVFERLNPGYLVDLQP
jgi:hypothetical protein